jgi:DNA-directed RNA polymerase specialized sigma24 family protein
VSLDERRADVQYRYLGSLAQDSTPETGRARREQLRQALDQLPDHQRQVVELRHGIQGSSHEFTDIARLLAISRSAAYQR